jgi:sirohydrochlorin ferrochelatase
MSDALILVGHGSRSGHADDVLPYYVDLFLAAGDYEEVLACYLEKEPGIDGCLGRVRAKRVFVMPLLLSRGYHTEVTIPKAMGMGSRHCFIGDKEVFYLEPLGRSELIFQLIRSRIKESTLKTQS